MSAESATTIDRDAPQPYPPEAVEELRQRVLRLEKEAETLRADLKKARESPTRRRLPATRKSVTHKFTIGGYEGYMTVGLFEDERPGELFLTMAKEGSTVGGLTDAVGILTSLALQYGVPAEALARKFEHARFEPSGPTGDSTMGRASSVIDYVFRWLGINFSQTYRDEKSANCAQRNGEPHRLG